MPSSANHLNRAQDRKEEESSSIVKEDIQLDELISQQMRELVEDLLYRVERNLLLKQDWLETGFILSEEYFEAALSMNDALSLCRKASGIIDIGETSHDEEVSNIIEYQKIGMEELKVSNSFGMEKVDDSCVKPNKVLDTRSESTNQLSPELKAMLASKQERFDYFNDGLVFVKQLVRLSSAARDAPSDKRYSFIQRGLDRINELFLRRMSGLESHPSPLKPPPQLPSLEWLAQQGRAVALRSLHLPIARAVSRVLRILRFVPEETIVFPTRTRVPFLVFVEVVETNMLCCSQYVFFEHMLVDDYEENDDKDIVAVMESPHIASHIARKRTLSSEETPPSSKETRSGSVESSTTPSSKQKEHVRNAVYGNSVTAVNMEEYVESGKEDLEDPDSIISRDAALLAVYGEIWHWKAERIRKASPFGHFSGWKLASFIVKAGDDLRQEQLAVQLIAQFRNIFVEEDLELWVRPFTVVCLSADSGLVETLPDAVSLHALKKRTPNFVTLLDYFERVYGGKDSKRFRRAQRNFVESMAGYSLVCYLLQIKDRHNGNIMLDSQGRVIHIDFGFMLGNSPGSIRFESAPFKLTAEFVDVMGGTHSEAFQYFRELMVQGFLAARKHHEKLTTLVEIMIEGTKIPCMHGGHSVLESFRQRFCLGLLENECIHHMLSLIDESVDNWRTRQYDRYQFYTNGIL
ncbi:Phosphatidylinositol 4-kinase [Galdieria sulphuraria]|nr:Phosphatidylinositol 4-kinase [Galdieria sulphuraria]